MSILNTWEPNINSTQDLLTALTSTSRVSIFALIFWCVASCAVALDVVFQLTVVTMTEIAAKSRYGTLPWYVAIAKEFQYGDPLVEVNQQFVYAVTDPTKQIVALAAAKEGTGVVNLKIAKLSGTTPVPLSSPQVDAFRAYIAVKKPAGINVNVINDNPDQLQFYLRVIINPLVLTPTGESILKPGTYPVEDAINLYLNSLDFDGKFDTMAAVIFIKNTVGEGVVSAYVTNALARYGANSFVSFTENYYSNAGYMVIDPANPLNTTITYE